MYISKYVLENMLDYATTIRHKIQQSSKRLMNKVLGNHLRKTCVVVVKGVGAICAKFYLTSKCGDTCMPFSVDVESFL